LVNVRKKKNIQTSPCRPSGELSDLQLNKSEGSSSVVDFKTLSNSSKESRKQKKSPTSTASHNGTDLPKHSASKEDFVFVIGQNGKPLMPTKSGKARRMLKAGLAKVVSRTPFVIKMLVETCEYKQKLDAGMDTGSKNIGVAVKLSQEPVYMAEVRLRSSEIRSKMEQRAMYRRTRRGRKTRYRMARFLNRSASRKIGRLPPSVKHIVDAHLREKNYVESILPSSYLVWHVETASFDIHKITNPNVIDYQKGRKFAYLNTKSCVLSRDSYTCQSCKAKETKLHVHHILFRSNGGSDSPDNLITLCETCHHDLHQQKDAQKLSLKLAKKATANTKDATKVSIVRSQIRKLFGNFVETFGYETKAKRQILGFPKTHAIDALLIASEHGEVVNLSTKFIQKRLVSQGDYQQTSGAHSQKRIPTGKLFGIRKFDLIKTSKGTGFVKGKRSRGEFAISKITGESISDSVNVKKAVIRLSARKTALKQWKNSEAQFLHPANEVVSLRKSRWVQ
jgi:5-methylcytosine-specific restriction endonuclease McrA